MIARPTPILKITIDLSITSLRIIMDHQEWRSEIIVTYTVINEDWITVSVTMIFRLVQRSADYYGRRWTRVGWYASASGGARARG
jgi:hypothetical protein